MGQWVKNLTSVAQVAVEVQVQSPTWCSCSSGHSCGSDLIPGLGTSIYVGVGHFKKMYLFWDELCSYTLQNHMLTSSSSTLECWIQDIYRDN